MNLMSGETEPELWWNALEGVWKNIEINIRLKSPSPINSKHRSSKSPRKHLRSGPLSQDSQDPRYRPGTLAPVNSSLRIMLGNAGLVATSWSVSITAWAIIAWSYPRILVGQRRFIPNSLLHLSSPLEIKLVRQSIKPTVELLSYILPWPLTC